MVIKTHLGHDNTLKTVEIMEKKSLQNHNFCLRKKFVDSSCSMPRLLCLTGISEQCLGMGELQDHGLTSVSGASL